MSAIVTSQYREPVLPKKSRRSSRSLRIALFGHFGMGNFGNESTLQAILQRIRGEYPNADISCICTGPEEVRADYDIAATPMTFVVVKPWRTDNPILRLLRKLTVGITSECYRWFKGIKILRKTDVFIVPGTGLLTDAYSLEGWGPLSTFKWTVIAKLCRCRVMFVSVGAGPLYSRAGQFLVRAVLTLADFRSFRDLTTLEHVRRIGVPAQETAVYPDLAFSLQMPIRTTPASRASRRPIVALGLMEYAGRYSIDRPTQRIYMAYMNALVEFAKWLLAHDYDIRLIYGDIQDKPVTQEFRALLNDCAATYDATRIIDEPIVSVDNLLAQLAASDLVVATRFHNVLLALLVDKPVLAITFHHKCVSLMRQMGLSEYSQDINTLTAPGLLDTFLKLERNSDGLKPLIHHKAHAFRVALDKQYDEIFRAINA